MGSLLVQLLPADVESKDLLRVICLCDLNGSGSLKVLFV